MIDNLRGLGFVLNNADDVFNAINALHEQGDDALIVQAFSVPLLTDQMDPAELAIVSEVMSGQMPRSGGAQRSVEMDASSWAAIAGLGVSLIGILSGQPVQQQSTTNPTNTATPTTATKTDNTTTYVLIGAAILVVVVVIVLVLRKK